ncbi:MAG: hypothetical protein ACT4NU_02110 [Chromatiales bacterium]
MLKRSLMVMLIFLGGLGAIVSGQEATEQFIPMGQSPGVSGKTSVMGQIDSFDESSQVLTISATTGMQSITLTENTRIWRDRSEAKQSNQVGEPADLQQGRKVEVNVKESEGQRVAEWVKVQVVE